MIKELTMYTVVCDNCGKNIYAENNHCWEEKDMAEEDAVDYWFFVKVDDKHYCDRCHELDDEDNIVIKHKQ